jgi:hypothetical protein
VTTLIKLFYAGAIAALLILLVAFGIRTFYAAPEEPRFPELPPSLRSQFVPVPPKVEGDPTPASLLTPDQIAYQEAQEQYQRDFERYMEERADYRRNVFLAASIIGVLAIAAGLLLSSELDAIRLGLVAGGLGTLIYAVAQAGEDLDEFGPTVVFIVALIALALVLGAGYRWLGRTEAA